MKARWQRIGARHKLVLLGGILMVVFGSAIAFAALGLHSPVDEPAVATSKTSATETSTTPLPSSGTTEPPAAHGAGQECTVCHVAAHKDRGTCTDCHKQAGVSWAFDHPDSDKCAVCHTPPARHSSGECSTCHASNVPWRTAQVKHSAGMDCTSCHKVPHKPRGACVTCHRPGVSWTFSHPKGSTCTSCHSAPAKHYGTKCGSCHTPGRSFGSAKVRHTSGMDCSKCHKPPHQAKGACVTCHAAGVSWAFRHPRRADCATCHRAPARHYGSSCSTCHTTGRAFRSARIAHSAKLDCVKCHTTSHPGRGTCASCHSPGVSWAFRHPQRSDCATCHRAPATHYGTSCSSCHSIGRSFGSATFSHPSVPGGEHSYRSFACANCHPSGYSSHSCAKCHDSASGPSEDDD